MQITIGASAQALVVGVSNPWTEYVKMLPNSTPLPTMWTEEERAMLIGTSLEVSFIFLAWTLWKGHDPICRRKFL